MGVFDYILDMFYELLTKIRAIEDEYNVSILEPAAAAADSILNAAAKVYEWLKWAINKCNEIISCTLRKLKNGLRNIFTWIKEKVSYYFKKASEKVQYLFIESTVEVDEKLIAAEKEAEELLEASKINKSKDEITRLINKIHSQTTQDSENIKTIFGDAKTASDLQHGMKNKDKETLHHVTLDLLEMSTTLAEKLEKESLKDVQDIFEILSGQVKDEFKNKIVTHTKMLSAAAVAAGQQIDVVAFNESLGIKGDPKEYYWREAILTVMKSSLARDEIKREMKKRENKKEISIFNLAGKTGDNIVGAYGCVGVRGAGEFTATELIQALKKNQRLDLNEEELKITVTSPTILICSDHITIAAIQEVKSDGTSEGLIFIEKMEV